MVDLQLVISYFKKPFDMGFWKRKSSAPVEVKKENRVSVYVMIKNLLLLKD